MAGYNGIIREVRQMEENEYRHNSRFRKYVDEYCREHGVTTEEALDRDKVRQAFWRFTEV